MYLNTFAAGAEPLDMTQTDEFRSLLTSAAELVIPHVPDVAYRSPNVVLRQMRSVRPAAPVGPLGLAAQGRSG
jgi:hypothetical protein